MISIITSIHNQLAMNKLFYEQLMKCATLPFELIVIDNNSTDGSREFFSDKAQHIIANQQNFSYPYCQNQGITVARYDHLAFFNNDLLVSEKWDERILALMQEKKIEVISFATNDHLESKEVQKKLHRKWKRIKYPLRTFLGTGTGTLKLMLALMYGNFQRFCESRWQLFGQQVIEGFSGSCIIMNRSVLDKVGLWDESMQDADFDLFFRVKERSLTRKDIRPVQLALGIYFHHFQRLTMRSRNLPRFADEKNFLKLPQKWGDKMKTLYQDVVG